MTNTLSIALAQLNPTVGDVDGNVARLLAARDEAAKQGADLVVSTELFVVGYPPEDQDYGAGTSPKPVGATGLRPTCTTAGRMKQN